MATYTNVQDVTHDGNSLSGVKSITVNENQEWLLSQADGARQQAIVGELGKIAEISLEFEDEGAAYNAYLGVANEGDLVWKAQLDSDKSTLKTWTATDVVLNSWGYSSDQGAPNSQTLSGRTKDESDTITVA